MPASPKPAALETPAAEQQRKILIGSQEIDPEYAGSVS